MPMMMRDVLLLMLVATVGCVATVPMNAKRPVEVQSAWYGTSYLQAGVDLERSSMQDVLESQPNTEGLAQRSKWLGRTSTVLSVVSTAFLAYGLYTGNILAEPNSIRPSAPLTTSIVLSLSAVVLSIISESDFDEAVEVHNARFSTAPR